MDYSRPEVADRLAAEYVLGTLRGSARRRFETLLLSHPLLRRSVAGWEARLAPYAQPVLPVTPPDSVWHRIESQLFDAAPRQRAGPAATPRRLRWWEALGLWQGVAMASLAAAIGLGMLASRSPVVGPPIVIVLGNNPETAQTLNASFVASVGADGRSLVLRPINAVPLATGRALELWAVPAQGAPRSLGLVRPDGATTVLRAEVLRNTSAFAVSLEPAGGSPSGAPTGPIVSVGKVDI